MELEITVSTWKGKEKKEVGARTMQLADIPTHISTRLGGS